MSAVTITITEDKGQVTQPDDTQGFGTIASFRDGTAAAPSIGAKSLRQIDVEPGLASS